MLLNTTGFVLPVKGLTLKLPVQLEVQRCKAATWPEALQSCNRSVRLSEAGGGSKQKRATATRSLVVRRVRVGEINAACCGGGGGGGDGYSLLGRHVPANGGRLAPHLRFGALHVILAVFLHRLRRLRSLHDIVNGGQSAHARASGRQHQ